MAHDEPAPSGAPTKLAIKNVGLMLSGDLEKPILDADAIVAIDGRITAIGRAADLDLSRADDDDRCPRRRDRARPDRQSRPSGRGRLDASAEPAQLDRFMPAWRSHDDGVRGRSSHARPAPRHRRSQGDGDHCAALLFELSR